MAKDGDYEKSANAARKRSHAAKESSDRHSRDVAEMRRRTKDAADNLRAGQKRQKRRENSVK
jgi:hypothetical protein